MTTSEQIRIKREPDGITVHVKPKKAWFVLCFIPIFLIPWTYGGIRVINELLKGEEKSPIVILWLGFWVMAESLLIFALVWNIFGEEIISVRNGRFTRKLAVGGLGIKKTFPANEVFNLRTSRFFDDSSTKTENRFWGKLGLAERALAVDTKYLTLYRFGIRLEDNEALAVAQALESYLPSSQYSMSVPPPDVK